MKKGWIIVIAVAAVIILAVVAVSGAYNGLVDAELEVDAKEATIDTMLTRRADLIPNLVNTVKGYAAHESEVYTAISDARAKLAGSNTTEEKMEANDELSSALSRLLVVVENYPELKADTQFIALQDQLEGAENRISTARVDYNEAVKDYNKKLRRFPTSIIAGMFGFEARDMYDAPAGDSETPVVDFN
ncbi:MAG: LemA family protein [Clostridia bacterium]|nr:LemA family protein [Clostridia bacterium]